MFLQREIIDEIRKSYEKMETYSRKADEEMDKFDRKMENYSKKTNEGGHISADGHRYSRNTGPWDELNHCENERRRRQIQANQWKNNEYGKENEETNPEEHMESSIRVRL